VNIVGEVTQFKVSARGHVYFTLKDKEQEAILECVIWRSRYALYGIDIEIGMELVASGTANIFAPWGKLSFIAEIIELVGEGALKKKYDALKKKLTLEGLFADERKRKLPALPRKIGVVTSKQGAVIHDFMNNLGRHGFQITFIDSRVEGSEAIPDLYQALKTLKNKDLDVIVLMRGGGSIQSLAAFDAEVIVREIASSQIPIIAAIGHHQDVPLCALAADVMVSTPTAAANLLNTSWDNTLRSLNHASQEILYRFHRILDSYSHAASQVPSYLFQISTSIEFLSKKLTDYTQKILKSMENAVAEKYSEIDTQNKLLNIFDPMRQLSLGYSLVQGNNHRLVRSIKDVKINEEMSIIVQDGIIDSTVKAIKKLKYDKTN